jgi:hypothetical protein
MVGSTVDDRAIKEIGVSIVALLVESYSLLQRGGAVGVNRERSSLAIAPICTPIG